VLTKCSAVVLKAGKEGQYEKEGYGQRPYDNWETILFNCEGQVCLWMGAGGCKYTQIESTCLVVC